MWQTSGGCFINKHPHMSASDLSNSERFAPERYSLRHWCVIYYHFLQRLHTSFFKRLHQALATGVKCCKKKHSKMFLHVLFYIFTCSIYQYCHILVFWIGFLGGYLRSPFKRKQFEFFFKYAHYQNIYLTSISLTNSLLMEMMQLQQTRLFNEQATSLLS